MNSSTNREAFVSAIVISVVCLVAHSMRADPAQDIYAKYADSVVTITAYDDCLFPMQQGSGVIIKSDEKNGSFVLTNYHVIHRTR